MPTIKTCLRLLSRPGFLMPLAAGAAGLAAAFSASHYLRHQAQLSERAIQQRYNTRDVIVASRDLPKGHVLDSTVLAVRRIPDAFMPADAMPPARASELIGGRTTISIRRGTPVVLAALSVERTPSRLSQALAPGQRALTIQVDQVNAVGGHLGAGDTVDLYYSQREHNSAVLTPLLENVHVLATGIETEEAQPGDADEQFSTITLRLDAEQAARIVLAEQTGRLTVLLRATGDLALAEIRTRNSQQLLPSPRGHLSLGNEPPVELLTGGQGEITPARSWLKVGAKTPAISKESI